MRIVEFLASLRERGITLKVEDGRLHCDAPLGALTADLRLNIAERKAEIITFLETREGAIEVEETPILRYPRDHGLPLSFAQERLWFIDQLQPGSTGYNMSGVLRITGVLEADVLERTINEIVRRHEVLRTTYQISEKGPIQVIHQPSSRILPIVDLTAVSDREREMAVRQITEEENRLPFDLVKGTVLRVSLLRLAAEEHVVLCTMHHIASDGWSIGVLKKELSVLYGAFAKGEDSPLPELPIQYSDFAIWQRNKLLGHVLAEQLKYWKKQLAGMNPLQLPTDYVRPAIQTFNGAAQKLRISSEITGRIKKRCQDNDVTLFMMLLSGVHILLSRYTGQEDIVVGSPMGTRTRVETEDLIGLFLNTLVLRTDLSGNPTVLELLKREKVVTSGAYANHDLPFERLVEELQPERDISRNPLVQIWFALQNAPGEQLGMKGMAFSPIDGLEAKIRHDVEIHIWEQPLGLFGSIVYNTNLFEAERIERMGRHLERLLEEMANKPQSRISELVMMGEQEREQMVVKWNETANEFPDQKCLHELFELQAREQPDAVAIFFREQALTYGELNRRSNQVASYLRALGVRPNDIVAICITKSVEMIVGVLGILKAGGGYLPLDPAYPPDRLAFMLRDASVSVLVTEERFEGYFTKLDNRTIYLDAETAAIAAQNESNLNVPVISRDLAYVLYTSGSTGSPKAVMLNHQGRVNNFLDFNRRFSIGRGDRVLGVSSLNFDMSAYDIFGLLAAGGAVVVPDPVAGSDPAHWLRLMRTRGVTVWHSVPVLLEMLVDQLERETGRLTDLRLVLLGGDWIPVTLPNRIRALIEGVQVISMGGATEVSMDSTIYEIRAVDASWKSIPYGRPMANQTCYVLDHYLNVVPVGIPGELYLGGVGVGWGYLNRPELSAERFVPDAYSQLPGNRLYRTGDMVTYLPDGNLKLLGRIDHQIKIRGLRVELGEIDTLLRQHAGVKEVAITVQENKLGDKHLVAFVVAQPNQRIEAEVLQNFLKPRLPNYMVPSLFIFLEALPLSPNGKVDRRALSVTDTGSPSLGHFQYAPPGKDTEKIVAGIWAEVLGLDRVGIHAPFFKLGGHSLLATQVISRLRDIYPFEIPLSAIFKAPTVAELAHEIEELGRAEGNDVPKVSKLFLETKDLSADEMNALLEEGSRSIK